MTWREAKSLETLRAQIDAAHPDRSKGNDGTIGDTAHAARKSDHNPDGEGVVRAMDITHDPAHGVDSYALAEVLRLNRDPRLSYVISNHRIFNAKVDAWEWRPYTGESPHTEHVHVSVVADDALADDTRPWVLAAQQSAPTAKPGRMTGITATVFGGAGDRETSAYDGHVIADAEFGCALPYRFARPMPTVRVFSGSRSVACPILDVGPWNTDDPYWTTGARPQAESGTDHHGRRTNHAGIDLTPAAARMLGIDGKGVVDWEFMETHMTDTTTLPDRTLDQQQPPDALRRVLDYIHQHPEFAQANVGFMFAMLGLPPPPVTAQPQPQPQPRPDPQPAPQVQPTGIGSILNSLGGGSGVSFWVGLATAVAHIALNAAGVVGGPVGAGATMVGQLLPAIAGSGVLGGIFTRLGTIAAKLPPLGVTTK